MSGADATESGSQSVSVTITENESAPTVTLTVSATSIAENAGSSLTVTATLSGATHENVTVQSVHLEQQRKVQIIQMVPVLLMILPLVLDQRQGR